MKTKSYNNHITYFLLIIFIAFNNSFAQKPKNRIAKIVIDSLQLKNYKAALKLEIETSLKIEPGVLMLHAVTNISKPNHFTIFETYANEAAYQSHIKSAHFVKYKSETSKMVQFLELIEVEPLLEKKGNKKGKLK